jgi:hypothetical protein
MKKEKFKMKFGLTEDQFLGKDVVGGYLNLGGLTSIPQGFNPIVGGSLDLGGLTFIPEGFNPTVGGYLYLNGLTFIPQGFNPTVGENLHLNGLTFIPEGFNPIVGGYLHLNGLTSIPQGFNPTVGGCLNLGGLTSIPQGFNTIVGGSLDLRGLTSIPEGFNPTVGGYLYLGGLTSTYTPLGSTPLVWLEGKYIKVDGIFTEVINKKGNVYKVKKLNSSKEFYLVTNGDGKYSHGDTLKLAKEDLIYKIKSDIDSSKYKDLTLESVLTFEEGIECYRVITGACSFGVKDFVKTQNIENKTYTISQILELTKGSYGGSNFKSYFN